MRVHVNPCRILSHDSAIDSFSAWSWGHSQATRLACKLRLLSVMALSPAIPDRKPLKSAFQVPFGSLRGFRFDKVWDPSRPTMILEAQQRYFSYPAIHVAIVSQNSFVLGFMGYHTIIAQYSAIWGIAQMCLCETKCTGGYRTILWER